MTSMRRRNSFAPCTAFRAGRRRKCRPKNFLMRIATRLNEMIQAFEKDDQAAVALGQDKLDKVRDDLKIDDEPEIEATDAAREPC